jgi:hypothetical protein
MAPAARNCALGSAAARGGVSRPLPHLILDPLDMPLPQGLHLTPQLEVKRVPALVCANCGEEYLHSTITERVLSMAEEAAAGRSTR